MPISGSFIAVDAAACSSPPGSKYAGGIDAGAPRPRRRRSRRPAARDRTPRRPRPPPAGSCPGSGRRRTRRSSRAASPRRPSPARARRAPSPRPHLDEQHVRDPLGVGGELVQQRLARPRRSRPRARPSRRCRAATGSPAAPLANSSTVSFVLVHASTVSALNRGPSCSAASRWRSSRATAASVVTNTSIVARFGLIMPDAFRAAADAIRPARRPSPACRRCRSS